MAARFWVGGTGTWDASDTTHWAATSNGAGGQSVPGSADAVTFDGLSGGGTVTVNFGGTISLQSLTTGAFTGTLDFSANNDSVTLSAASGFLGSGSGTRTINLGNGTWTLTGTTSANIWDLATVTGLTFNANSSTISLTGAAAGTTTRTFAGGGRTYATLQIGAAAGLLQMTGVNTFSVVTATGNCSFSSSGNQTITTLNLNGTSGNVVTLMSSGFPTQRIFTVTTLNATWAAIRAINFSGSKSATNSFDLGHNSNITITPPASGGGGISRARAGF